MKTKKYLSDVGIYHTGKKQQGHSTNYLSSDLPPNSSNNANDRKERDRFGRHLSLPLERANMP